jgi:heme exporter protein D
LRRDLAVHQPDVTALGLVAALIGDGIWDVFSWIALGIPVATLAVFVVHSSRNRAQ